MHRASRGPTLTAGHNGDGLRAWKQTGTNASTRTYFLYDGTQPVAELDSTGMVLKAADTFGANGLISRNAGGASTFYTFDPQCNVCQRFNSSAQVLSSDMYDAFGAAQRTPGGTTDVFGYGGQAGYYTDPETGLILLTHRYYDPGTGGLAALARMAIALCLESLSRSAVDPPIPRRGLLLPRSAFPTVRPDPLGIGQITARQNSWTPFPHHCRLPNASRPSRSPCQPCRGQSTRYIKTTKRTPRLKLNSVSRGS